MRHCFSVIIIKMLLMVFNTVSLMNWVCFFKFKTNRNQIRELPGYLFTKHFVFPYKMQPVIVKSKSYSLYN